MLSDHRDAAFGKAYSVLIEELRLLARAVFVVDRGGRIQYIQVGKELTEEPQPLLVANGYRFLGYV
jgi:thiol peroxidase